MRENKVREIPEPNITDSQIIGILICKRKVTEKKMVLFHFVIFIGSENKNLTCTFDSGPIIGTLTKISFQIKKEVNKS